jgi:hypothetical protein
MQQVNGHHVQVSADAFVVPSLIVLGVEVRDVARDLN